MAKNLTNSSRENDGEEGEAFQ